MYGKAADRLKTLIPLMDSHLQQGAAQYLARSAFMDIRINYANNDNQR